MTNTIEKFDDLDWHSSDAANEVQAAVHIALMYHWLRTRNMLNDPDLPTQELDVHKVLPGEFFARWLDGQLVSENMKPEAIRFLEDYYSDIYLSLVSGQQIPRLRYDPHFEAPYNLCDSWKNVEIMANFLDKEYAQWQKRGISKRKTFVAALKKLLAS